MEKSREILTAGLRELGIDPKSETITTFDLYRNELKKWNRVYNITSITDDNKIVVKHFLDSLLYLKAIPQGHLTLCDVGSGGGFPGIPLAIIRQDIEVTLLEPARKKIAFLRQIRRLLSLENVEIIDCRAEDMEESEYDVVVTRATFTVSDMLEKAGHLMKKGGLLILSKGPKYEEEIKQLSTSVTCDVITVSLAEAALSRHLIRITRT